MKSEGLCKFCKKTISGSGMTRHLQSCTERIKVQTSGSNKGELFLIRASAGPFWVYFEIDTSSTLGKIDSFLRDLWLECCGHLSMFTIGTEKYASNPQQDYGDCSMNAQLKNILHPGLQFLHEYDFGTTTELGLKCISKRYGELKNEIDILARNNLPEFDCSKCKKSAKEICSECIWHGKKGFLCETCAKDHQCGDEAFLPVVNSPRMGMCGYTGND